VQNIAWLSSQFQDVMQTEFYIINYRELLTRNERDGIPFRKTVVNVAQKLKIGAYASSLIRNDGLKKLLFFRY
jgi:hypothetical protein